MKIFITGVAGFLGSHLADAMLEDGHEVSGCDNMTGGEFRNIPTDVEFHLVDCNSFEKMAKIIEGMELVYHCAATAHEGLSVFSPYMISKNNITATTSVISASIRKNVRKLIICSSMARYGTQDVVPFTEDMIPKPQDPYGICKHAGELILRSLAEVHSIEYSIVVPHNIIGARQKYDDPFRNVASIMINLMLQGRQPFIYGDGLQKRCFSSVRDDIEILKQIGYSEEANGEIFNIGPDNEFITILELAERIAALLDFDLNPMFVKDRPQEVKFANCSADKIRKYFGYKPKYTLDEGLIEMIEDIDTTGPKPFKYHLDLEIINDKCPDTWKNRLF